MELILVLAVFAALAYAAYKSPLVRERAKKVFGTKTTNAAVDLAKKVEDKIKK